jgi:hypothetical protein
MSELIVERTFDTPLADGDLTEVQARLRPCLEQHRVRWIRTYFSRDRRRMICHYEAADAEAVRIANRSAGAGFDQVWNAHILTEERPRPDTDG